MSRWQVWTGVAMAGVLLAMIGRPTAAEQVKGPCASDAQRLCATVPAGLDEVMQCLRGHRTELSEACKQRIETVQTPRSQRHQACQPDIRKLCKDVKVGADRFLECLKDHEAQLSPACKGELAQCPARW